MVTQARGVVPPRVFVDTSYVLALLRPHDRHHEAALSLAARLTAARTQLVTTQAVLFEIGNALAKPRYRATAVQVLRSLESDPATQVVMIVDGLYARALAFYEARADQEWGLVDCASFVVMRELGLSDALTADRHFEQAGFRALLRLSVS